MTDRLDDMFRKLRAVFPDGRLDNLEDAVWARIDRRNRADAFSGRTLQVQLGVSCCALVLGALVAHWAGASIMPAPPSSETVVLSDDSTMAPSVRLEGGA